MEKIYYKPFTLTTTVSSAEVAKEYEPRYFTDEKDIIKPDFSNEDTYQLTHQQSCAQTPSELARSGRLLLGLSHSYGDRDFTESNLVTERRLGDFTEKNNALYINIYVKDELKSLILANFTIDILNRVRKVSLKDEEEALLIRINNNNSNVELSIRKDLFISDFQDQLQKEYPQFRINMDIRNAKALFRKYLSSVYESCMSNLNIETQYTYSGWIKRGNQFHYMSNLDSYCQSRFTLANIAGINPNYIFGIGWKVLDLGSPEITVPLFLQMHAGVMAKLFEDADMNIQYIFAMIGTTGSKKTSVAKQLFCLFGNEGTNFTSTDRGFELYTEKHHDFNVIIDDFSSAFNREQSGKLEGFLRQYCDTMGRSKSINGGKELETVKIRCGVVITAESRPAFLKTSSQLRILELHIDKNSFNEDILSFFQYNSKKADFYGRSRDLEIYLTGFIHFLERNYWGIVQDFMQFKIPQGIIKSDRLRRVYRILLCIARTVLNYGVESGYFLPEKSDNIFSTWQNIIYQLIIYNDQICARVEPYKLFLTAISTGIAQKQILISETKDGFKERSDTYIGYWESEFLKIDADRAYRFALSFNRNHGFVATDNDIWSELLNKKISEGYEQKNHRAKPLKSMKINDSLIKVLCLNWNKVKELLNEEE